MFREIVKKVKEGRGITGKALSDKTGISQNHISKFLNGERDVTTEMLWRLVEGMDKVSPGAKKEFLKDFTGIRPNSNLRQILSNVEPAELISALDEEMFADLIHAFAEAFKQRSSNNRSSVESVPPPRTSKLEPTSTKTYSESLVS